jgi:hypothetical protein
MKKNDTTKFILGKSDTLWAEEKFVMKKEKGGGEWKW